MDKFFKLRSDQEANRDKVLAEWATGNLSTLGVACPGSGKTEVGLSVWDSELAAGRFTRGLFVSHRIELVLQPIDRIRRHFPKLFELGTGIVMGGEHKPYKKIISASIQTLAKEEYLDEVLRYGAFSHVIFDEAHHASSRTYRALFERLRKENPQVRILGLTATPRGGSGKRNKLGQVFTTKAFHFGIIQAIQGGVIVPYKAATVHIPIDFSEVPVIAGDFHEAASAAAMSAPNALEIVVRNWQERASDRLTIAYTVSVVHAQLLAQEFQKAGVPVAFVSGQTPKEERAQTIADFLAGKIRVICNCQVFGEGVDLPQASCMLQCRPTCSDSVYLQLIGRVLRTALGKRDAFILDFAPNNARHPLVLAEDVLLEPREERMLRRKAEKSGIVLPEDEEEKKQRTHRGIDAEADLTYTGMVSLLLPSRLPWFLAKDGLITASLAKDRALCAQETPTRYRLFHVSMHPDGRTTTKIVTDCETFDGIVATADNLLKQVGEIGYARKSVKWRRGKPTKTHRALLAGMGIPLERIPNADFAEKVITDYFCRGALGQPAVESYVIQPVPEFARLSESDLVVDRIRKQLDDNARKRFYAGGGYRRERKPRPVDRGLTDE